MAVSWLYITNQILHNSRCYWEYYSQCSYYLLCSYYTILPYWIFGLKGLNIFLNNCVCLDGFTDQLKWYITKENWTKIDQFTQAPIFSIIKNNVFLGNQSDLKKGGAGGLGRHFLK